MRKNEISHERQISREAANDGTDELASQTALDVDELVVGYPSTDELVIDGQTLAVPDGEVTALIGPNGSGKSTLLKALANRLEPDDGRVLLDDRRVDSFESKELARKLGRLSQQNTAPDTISVEELVERGRYPHQGFFESQTDDDAEAVDEAIAMAGVDHLRDREIGTLSGGQTQLVWIAMALAQDTDVLLLDEPTTFLDPRHQLEVMQVVEMLRDKSDTTVVLVLHDISQAARYADNVVALKEGTIYASGPPEAIVTDDLLADVFDIDSEVIETEHGPVVVPLDPIVEPSQNETNESEMLQRGSGSPGQQE
ncbi:ABC transporter ATP-binding protein [Haloarcula argentinensis]|uniref:ABC transporter ATP-binding protein n=1 Tax=Haloarcula argentinensis TaxID=43776 RepID=A0ABU2F5N2_HALAR|nr:ABC transporter ATP-binding protein [Haloarcula argentinensis]EMA26789.1 iron/cobalamin ABC-type transporter ATP-binding protein [Haloarcula argentinensis DSM 12282]MDS0255884.1 ABC transporter ATP-binding protein [Haloarcula argentinensis]